MKPVSCIYLIPPGPIFNVHEVPGFLNLNKNDSSSFYSALLTNHIENASIIGKKQQIILCLEEKDKDFVPAYFDEKVTLNFYDCSGRTSALKFLADKYFGTFGNNLVVFTRSIGVSAKDLEKAFDLISMDDEAAVIGKCNNDSVAFFGFNKFNIDIFADVNFNSVNFNELLSMINKLDNFIHVMGNYQYLKGLDDFKILYNELSKKESWGYCNQSMHEQFTHLFIEYKDLLK